MSTPTTPALKALIAEKLHARDEKIKSAGADLEESGRILSDYSLFFSGAREALTAVSGEGSTDVALVKMVADANDAEIDMIERRIQISKELA